MNEYLKDATILKNGQKEKIPSLNNIEDIEINNIKYEAFTTSGGIGTLCESLKHRCQDLNYKTIRYPGHFQGMKLLCNELELRKNPVLLTDILTVTA